MTPAGMPRIHKRNPFPNVPITHLSRLQARLSIRRRGPHIQHGPHRSLPHHQAGHAGTGFIENGVRSLGERVRGICENWIIRAINPSPYSGADSNS